MWTDRIFHFPPLDGKKRTAKSRLCALKNWGTGTNWLARTKKLYTGNLPSKLLQHILTLRLLIRASFCQTFSEFKVSNLGEWKSVTAGVLFLLCVPLWLYYYFKLTIYADMMPDSFKEENRAAQFRRLLDLRVNPIRGLASRWDYDKDDWKNPNDSWRTKPKE